jgi:hypothetical protein
MSTGVTEQGITHTANVTRLATKENTIPYVQTYGIQKCSRSNSAGNVRVTLTLRHVRTFASWTLLRRLHNLIHQSVTVTSQH